MNLKIKLLKYFDSFAGAVLCEVLGLSAGKSSINFNVPKKILVIRPGGIGDAVLLLPMLGLLKNRYPDSSLDVLAEKRNSGVFVLCDHIDKLYLYDNIQGFDLIKVLKNRYDLVIDTEQWHRLSAVISFLTGSTRRIGFGTNNRKKMFTISANYDQNMYEMNSFIGLVENCTGEKSESLNQSPFIELACKDKNEVIAELRSYKSGFDSVAGIFTGATVRERRWGVAKYSMLAEKLLENRIGVVLLGGKAELSETDQINRILFEKNILDLSGKTSLYETSRVISMLDLFVSADTGLMHIASGLGTNTVSLFGAGKELKWAPKGKNHIVLNKNLFCSPCTEFGYTPRCCYNVRCLTEISVGEVFEASMKLLEKPGLSD